MPWGRMAAAMTVAVWYGLLWPVAVGLVLALLARRRGGSAGAWLWPALTYLYAGVMLQLALDARLPEHLNGEELVFVGRVVSLPETRGGVHYGEAGINQIARLEGRVSAPPGRWPGRHRLRVSYWNPDPPLRAGEWIRARLRPHVPRGTYNEAGFDAERYFLAEGIDARATVRAVEARWGGGGLPGWRQAISDRIAGHLATSPYGAAVIPALVVADRRGLPAPVWDLFRDTGTAHLLAISGLHLTLVSGMVWWLGRVLLGPLCQWLCGPLRRLPLALLAWPPAVAAAWGYAALAGFSLPTQRAALMISVLALAVCRRRPRPPLEILALALCVVLLRDPLAALSASLWLSFGAVLAILLIARTGGPWLWIGLPLMMAVISAVLFDSWHWTSPVANAVLVPLFSLLIVPLALTGALLDWPALSLAAATGVEGAVALMTVLTRFTPGTPPLLTGMAAAALLLAVALATLRAWPWPRRMLPLLMVPWLWPQSSAPPPGQLRMTVFDVGQGQAVALRTHEHLVLYDTGPAWPGGSAGSSVLEPWLRRQRLRPSITIVSHGDLDHAGGLRDLREPGLLLSGEPDRSAGAAPCQAGQSWILDGVTFRFLWPRDRAWQGNDASCVLWVEAGPHRVLLTGDITHQVEYRLLNQVAPVTVLVLSHHGSGTGTSRAWVSRLQPRWAVASAGYANRFGHPAPAVLERLEAAGVTVLRTDRAGMIEFQLGATDNAAPITRWRDDHGRPWHGPGGFW
ncbi:DNA internalization-related competence protein ComEC/Rec2 [Alloalcanivorax xenomutans]|uniref:DNA internalization-related competence protein ComEC/Rec2 n=1 Tax=Alloalcanivorax xenomutans TaxID=1094342 RepID=UPI001F34C260|nr:DNA internalization-related competence protein ComEC/Rec2 [Alloalcanivorax xenomutans]MCE7521659.1 DNA internalization-related competence protein ComEC/Rec2 [Alloalcanivorax xenomutans]